MESDDDYQFFSPPEDLSSPVHGRKLKRLKKAIRASNDDILPNPSDECLSMHVSDSSEFNALESLEAAQEFEESNESLPSRSVSEGFDGENESSFGFEENPSLAKRALEFDSVDGELDTKGEDASGEMGEEVSDLNNDSSEKKQRNLEDFKENKENKRVNGENDSSFCVNGLRCDENPSVAKRALVFDSVDGEFDAKGDDASGEMGKELSDLDIDNFEKKRQNLDGFMKKKEKKKRQNLEGSKEKKEKNKRVKSDSDDAKRKASASNKRREEKEVRNLRRAEKERRDHLNQLHAESQRLLRETREAAFKPIPHVQKPISSVLEKIRQRKLEVSKKWVLYCTTEKDAPLRDVMMDLDSENIPPDDIEGNKSANVANDETIVHPHEVPIDDMVGNESEKVANVETIVHPPDMESSLPAGHIDGSNESAKDSGHENIPSQEALDEESKHAFRAPIDDTQDMFYDSQTSDTEDELPSEKDNSPLEEVFAPSLLAMNLKLDSAPPDDISSDDEDNDKENMDPRPHGLVNLRTSPKGDPVKAFVDDEAVEEDDSDNDLFRFQENEEDEDTGDAEELNDMIATEYEEKELDTERRHQLHQKWLEQQDATGTDNLMLKLKCGSKQRETTLLEEEEDMEEDEEDLSCEAAEDLVPTNVARINSKKMKQMIPHMFTDKDDAFLSSDDEETEKRLIKQRLLEKAEEHKAFLPPVEDESSREVFGLIKKLNIVPETKKKAKTSSFFDKLVTGKNSNSSSKSSFLGRVSNNSLPSSHKRGSITVRSFIFERDDSNSRSAISMSEDSSDTIQREIRPTRTASAKFSNSQSKTCTQNTKAAAKTISGTSLFEILRGSSMQQPNQYTNNDIVGRTQTVFASFKLPKKPIKIEGEY